MEFLGIFSNTTNEYCDFSQITFTTLFDNTHINEPELKPKEPNFSSLFLKSNKNITKQKTGLEIIGVLSASKRAVLPFIPDACERYNLQLIWGIADTLLATDINNKSAAFLNLIKSSQNPLLSAELREDLSDVVTEYNNKNCFTHLNLRDADLAHINLSGLNLTGSTLINAKLTNAALRGTILNDADLCLTNMEFADLTDAQLNKALICQSNLRSATLSSAKLNEANLTSSNLSFATLDSAHLHKANLFDAKLVSADLSDAELNGAYFDLADLTKAILCRAKLTATRFQGATLTEADLTNVIKEQANVNHVISYRQPKVAPPPKSDTTKRKSVTKRLSYGINSVMGNSITRYSGADGSSSG